MENTATTPISARANTPANTPVNTPASVPAFIFKKPSFDWASGVLSLGYGYQGGVDFNEVIIFPTAGKDLEGLEPKRKEAFLKLAQLLHYLAGVSYYKAYCPNEIIFEGDAPDADTARFLQKIYTLGLGEFAYENNLDILKRVNFIGAVSKEARPAPQSANLQLKDRALVPVGGGKDSVVSIEALKAAGFDITLFAVGGKNGAAGPIAQCMDVAGLDNIYVSRTLDAGLKALNDKGALNGHVPITAIISAIAAGVAILHDYNAIILSNEHSASAPNLVQDGFEVNHQYSKSFEFEQDFAQYLRAHIAQDLDYFSLLRPLSEAAIAKRFAHLTPYHSVFRSCNTAFRQDVHLRGTHWCCDCPKCRFVFLALAPFMPKDALVSIFGANLLEDESQLIGFKQLCGLVDFKPFECVGEIEESALLMQALLRQDEWKDALVVKACGIKTNDFDAQFDALLAPQSGHGIPARYLKVLA